MDDRKCLNHRFEKYCRFCVDICPHNAVTYTGRINVDETRCSGCGICAVACPARCLEIPEPDWETVLNKALEHPKPCLGCQRSLSGTTTIFVPCTGALPEELLAAISVLRGSEFGLDLTGCFECPQKTGLRQLQRSLFRARFITGGNLKFTAILPERDSNKKDSTLNYDHLVVLGRNFKKVSESLVNTMLPRELNSSPSAENRSLPRELLLKILPPNREGSIKLTSFKVDQNCTGCAFCQGVCPHKAWELVYKENSAVLSHYPLRCTDCGLCASACPQKAKHKISIDWSVGTDRPLESRCFQAGICTDCHKPVLVNKSSMPLCPSCKNRRKLQESIREEITRSQVPASF